MQIMEKSKLNLLAACIVAGTLAFWCGVGGEDAAAGNQFIVLLGIIAALVMLIKSQAQDER